MIKRIIIKFIKKRKKNHNKMSSLNLKDLRYLFPINNRFF
jgi:hypothetical protein